MRTNEQCRALKRQAQPFPKFPDSLAQFLRTAHRCPLKIRKRFFRGTESPQSHAWLTWNQWYALPLLLQLCLLAGTWQTDVGTASEPLPLFCFRLRQAASICRYSIFLLLSRFSFLESYMDPLISGNTSNKTTLSHEACISQNVIESEVGLPCCGSHWSI